MIQKKIDCRIEESSRSRDFTNLTQKFPMPQPQDALALFPNSFDMPPN
jgi:hypothetical protein